MPDLTTKLTLSTEHASRYAAFYSGDFKPLVQSHPGSGTQYRTPPHNYVGAQELKASLVAAGVISEDEFPLRNNATNGSHYWFFYPDVNRHRAAVAEFDEPRLILPDAPVFLDTDECGLLTRAYVVEPKKSENGYSYDSVHPEKFTEQSVLQVHRVVSFGRDTFSEIDDLYSMMGRACSAVNDVFTDLRARFHGTIDEKTQFSGIGFTLDVEGISLKVCDYDTARWMQQNVLPALNAVFANQYVSNAISEKQLIYAANKARPFHQRDRPSDADMPKSLKLAANEVVRSAFVKKYESFLDRAATDLQTDERVVKVFGLI